MDPMTSAFIGAFRQYVGKLQTIRNEVRTQRMLDSLPADLRKDIGWPDRYPEIRNRLI